MPHILQCNVEWSRCRPLSVFVWHFQGVVNAPPVLCFFSSFGRSFWSELEKSLVEGRGRRADCWKKREERHTCSTAAVIFTFKLFSSLEIHQGRAVRMTDTLIPNRIKDSGGDRNHFKKVSHHTLDGKKIVPAHFLQLKLDKVDSPKLIVAYSFWNEPMQF